MIKEKFCEWKKNASSLFATVSPISSRPTEQLRITVDKLNRVFILSTFLFFKFMLIFVERKQNGKKLLLIKMLEIYTVTLGCLKDATTTMGTQK